MKKTIYVLALTTVLFSACKNDKKNHHDNDVHSKDMPMKAMDKMDKHDDKDHEHGKMSGMKMNGTAIANITVRKNAATTPIIESYLVLKNALVVDDKSAAANAAKNMLAAFANFDMTKLSTNEHKSYMDIVEDAKEQAEHIAKSPIDHQREHFENLSIDINDLIVLLGTDKTLYQIKCPMASDGKGAIWLSEFKEIKNPYFGSKMLKCGNVEKQIN